MLSLGGGGCARGFCWCGSKVVVDLSMARLGFCSGDWGIRKRLEWWCKAVRVEQEVLFLMFLAVQNEKLSGSSHLDLFFLCLVCASVSLERTNQLKARFWELMLEIL